VWHLVVLWSFIGFYFRKNKYGHIVSYKIICRNFVKKITSPAARRTRQFHNYYGGYTYLPTYGYTTKRTPVATGIILTGPRRHMPPKHFRRQIDPSTLHECYCVSTMCRFCLWLLLRRRVTEFFAKLPKKFLPIDARFARDVPIRKYDVRVPRSRTIPSPPKVSNVVVMTYTSNVRKDIA